MTEQSITLRRRRTPAAVRAMRPRQWIKNVLVLAAPLAAGMLFDSTVILKAALAFVAFCFVSAAVYLINDVRDIDEDRLHPRKRLRPIPAGELTPAAALVLAAITGVLGFGIAFYAAVPLAITLAIYLGLQIIYSVFLKHQPVIDIAMVASGFLLRAIAGGVAAGIPLSQWFLLVASFGSLFMVAGKRYSEMKALGADAGTRRSLERYSEMKALGADAGTRRSLERYSESYLRFAWMMAAATVVMSYSLWAFENRGEPFLGVPWTALSIAPFTLGLLQYAMKVDAGQAGEPEDVVLRDHVLQGIGLIWLGLISVAVFA